MNKEYYIDKWIIFRKQPYIMLNDTMYFKMDENYRIKIHENGIVIRNLDEVNKDEPPWLVNHPFLCKDVIQMLGESNPISSGMYIVEYNNLHFGLGTRQENHNYTPEILTSVPDELFEI